MRGFTLIELLVVLVIIAIVSVLALAVVLPALSHRQVSEAARILQGALVGARDKAIHEGRPSGIRLLPDPAVPLAWTADGRLYPYAPLAYNRIVPIDPAPDYTNGRLAIFTDGMGGSSNYSAAIRTVNTYPGRPCLVIEQAVTDPAGFPAEPTNWFWNVRIGDKIRPNNSGPWYTIVGPQTIGPSAGNTEQFVNIGPPNTPLPVLFGGSPCEYLLLVNGRDDNGDGYIDNGFDGIDNNNDGIIDNAPEWDAYSVIDLMTGKPVSYGPEAERWIGAIH